MPATTTTVALISVGGTLGGASLALFGTLLTQYVTGRREYARREHERELKRMELEDNKQERHREERHNAYRKFYYAMQSMAYYIGAHKIGELTPESRGPLYQEIASASAEIELIAAPAVKDAANAWFQIIDSGAENMEACERAFVDAVRKDLGAPAADVPTDNRV